MLLKSRHQGHNVPHGQIVPLHRWTGKESKRTSKARGHPRNANHNMEWKCLLTISLHFKTWTLPFWKQRKLRQYAQSFFRHCWMQSRGPKWSGRPGILAMHLRTWSCANNPFVRPKQKLASGSWWWPKIQKFCKHVSKSQQRAEKHPRK